MQELKIIWKYSMQITACYEGMEIIMGTNIYIVKPPVYTVLQTGQRRHKFMKKIKMGTPSQLQWQAHL